MMGNHAIDAEAKKRTGGLVTQLREAFGEDLLSVLLYGSAARGDHFGAGSDLNVAVVLKDIALPGLERGTRANASWTAAGNRPLLFLSSEWIARSRDVFPMEFLDMLASHVVLHGADPLEGLAVSPENLRLQCESELKIKLIHLRTGYMELHEKTDDLARLMAASYAPIIAVCRGVLRAAGRAVPSLSDEVVRAVSVLCGIDPGPFAEVGAIKRGGPGAAAVAIKPLFKRYYAQVENLAGAVDAGFPKGDAR